MALEQEDAIGAIANPSKGNLSLVYFFLPIFYFCNYFEKPTFRWSAFQYLVYHNFHGVIISKLLPSYWAAMSDKNLELHCPGRRKSNSNESSDYYCFASSRLPDISDLEWFKYTAQETDFVYVFPVTHATLLEKMLCFIPRNFPVTWFFNCMKGWSLEACISWIILLECWVDFPLLAHFFGQLIWALSKWFSQFYLFFFPKSHR